MRAILYLEKLNIMHTKLKEFMMQSGEYIKGFTEIIACSLLSEGDDYIYNMVNRINARGGVRITNPSMLMTMKKLTEEGKVRSYPAAGAKGGDRKYYSLTELGREFYLRNAGQYLAAVDALRQLIEGGLKK